MEISFTENRPEAETKEPEQTTIATKLLRTVVPDSIYNLFGIAGLSFTAWFVAVSCVVFGVLFWYFYTQNCTLKSAVVPNVPEFSVYDAFNSKSQYICNAKLAVPGELGAVFSPLPMDSSVNKQVQAFYCQLGNIPCSAYGRFQSSLCVSTQCSNEINGNEVTENCFIGTDSSHSLSNSAFSVNADLSVEYLLCLDTSTALVNAMQYTSLCQFVAVLIFLYFWRVSNRGMGSIFTKEAYVNILGHKKRKVQHVPTKENDLSNESDKQEQEPQPQSERLTFMEHVADMLLKSSAPKSKYRFLGKSSFTFVAWYLTATGALLGFLLWYFIVGSCSPKLATVSSDLSGDDYVAAFATAGKTICSTKLSSQLQMQNGGNFGGFAGGNVHYYQRFIVYFN
jgi:hypothetical protein